MATPHRLTELTVVVLSVKKKKAKSKPLRIFLFSLLFVEIRAEKRRKSEEVDPMDPAAYSDAPKYDYLFCK